MAHEIEQFRISLVPVDPANFIVLTIGIVVALLGIADLIPGQKHGRALRQEQGCQHVALAFGAAVADEFIIGFALDTTIVAQVRIMPVRAIFAIRLIVPLIVARHIGQGEAIMRRDEIQRRPGPASVLVKLSGRAKQPRTQFLRTVAVTAPEAAHRIAEPVIPF